MKTEDMQVVRWLNENGITISKKLADAMAIFEFHNCGTVDDLASNFVKNVVLFAKEAIADPDNFVWNNDKIAVLINQVYESGGSIELQASIDDLEARLHTMRALDEIDNLLNELINCTVKSCDI